MPLEMRPGLKVGIPCRHCSQSMIPYELREGTQSLPCPRCGLETQVEAYSHEGDLRIRTSSVPSPRGKPGRS